MGNIEVDGTERQVGYGFEGASDGCLKKCCLLVIVFFCPWTVWSAPLGLVRPPKSLIAPRRV